MPSRLTARRLLTATALLVASAAAVVLVRRAVRPRPAPLATVPHVNLDRYLGRWYEIARLPAFFERGCTCTTAEYARAPDGTITVVNQCDQDRPGGKRKRATGRATVADPATNSKLKVSFFWPFSGDYWILALDENYQYALVGEPGRQYLWILSRTPRLAPGIVKTLVSQARTAGFPVEKLIFVPQR